MYDTGLSPPALGLVSISGELRFAGNASGFVFAALSDAEAVPLRLEML
jgi:hypothetical protein